METIKAAEVGESDSEIAISGTGDEVQGLRFDRLLLLLMDAAALILFCREEPVIHLDVYTMVFLFNDQDT
ncbi:hypothetical protein AAC387_Pa05g0162 [Persea americana]